MSSRSNTEFTAVVDAALVLLEERGPQVAAYFLEARGASFALICRVLLGEQARRRQEATTAAPAAPSLPDRPASA
nr:hypothetical protein [uncultured Massilia sp.]